MRDMNLIETCKVFEKISKPLLKNFPINMISYCRFYENGQRICLSNSTSFIEHFVENNPFFTSVPNPTMPKNLHTMVRIADVNALIVTTDSYLKNLYMRMMEDGRKLFECQEPYSILISKPGYFEEFSFFPNLTQVRAYETLIANHDVLQHFSFYFLEKAYDIIRQAKIYQYKEPALDKISLDYRNTLPLQTMSTQKYFIDTDLNIYLTKREAQCAHLLTRNYNSKEISDEMRISQRTAEEYIQNIKLKSQILNKSKLQAYLCQLGFNNLIEFFPQSSSEKKISA